MVKKYCYSKANVSCNLPVYLIYVNSLVYIQSVHHETWATQMLNVTLYESLHSELFISNFLVVQDRCVCIQNSYAYLRL